MKYVVTIPFTYKPYLDECLDSLDLPEDNILQVDNSSHNLGVGNSWNLGIDLVKEFNLDWLIVMSAAMRFGSGGLDMIKQLEDHPDHYLVHFAEKHFEEQPFVRGKSKGIYDGMFSWHCTAISRDVIENIGYFDPNFYPCGVEDIDYELRVKKFYKDKPGWTILPIDAHSKSTGHGIKYGKIDAPSDPLILYFAQKWGRVPYAPQLGEFDRPFNDSKNSLKFFPPAHGRLWDA